MTFPKRLRLIVKFLILCVAIFVAFPSCAHINDTCDTYCLRHGGQCNGVDYGTSRYDTITGDTKTRPTIFHCKFIN